MEQIELEFSDEEIFNIIKKITSGYREESQSYIKESKPANSAKMFELLGRATFNEFMINVIEETLTSLEPTQWGG
jgi:hypothetical protein